MADVNRKLDCGLIKRCNELAIPEGNVLVTYIWIDGTGVTLRNKTRTLETEPLTPKDVPVWTFDGPSTGQIPAGLGVFKSDLYLIPVAMFRDPFMGGTSKLVLCEVYNPDKKPSNTCRAFNWSTSRLTIPAEAPRTRRDSPEETKPPRSPNSNPELAIVLDQFEFRST